MVRPARAPLALAAAAAVLGLAACTGGAGPGGSASPAPSESSGPAVSPSAGPGDSRSPSPTLATLPPEQCLTGTYTLVRFVAASNETYGTGEGGDVDVAFDKGAYTLSSAGKKPVRLTLGGNSGTLTVGGRAKGSYTLDGSTATFKPGSETGSGTVELQGRSQRLSMAQVLSVIGLDGDGQVACTADAMTITLTTVRLELGRA